jgi:hypothetical protein
LVSTLREDHRLRVFENRVLRRIFGPKRDEVTGEWRKLHSEELHILYSSPNIIRKFKSRRMMWAGHVARMGEECVQGFDGKARRKETGESQKERDHLEYQGEDGRMGSEWMLGRLAWGVEIGTSWLRIRSGWRTPVNTAMNLLVLAPRS